MSFQRILVAVDEEPVAAYAADVGLELARALGAKLAFIYVVDPYAAAAPDCGIPASELIARAEEDGKRLLAGFCQGMLLQPTPLEFVQVGTPAGEIVKTATQWPADLIVIGSHGRGGVSRALLGSVAEAVMRHAPCPVLVIRAQAQRQATVPAAATAVHMDVLCADKTGTLTMNRLSFAGALPQAGFTADDVVRDGAWASNDRHREATRTHDDFRTYTPAIQRSRIPHT